MIRILAPMGSRSYFGAERANVDLLWRMQTRGAEVRCLVRHEEWPENLRMRDVLSTRDLRWECAPFPDYPSIRYWRYWPRVAIEMPSRYLRLNQIVERAIHENRITHIHLFNPFQAASLHRAINRTDVAVIYRSGELPVMHNAFYRRVWSWLVQRTTRFVTESHYLEGSLRRLGISLDRISVIRTPSPKRFPHECAVATPSFPSGRGPTFVYVGQIAEFKGVAMLVEALKIVRSIHPTATLQLAGPIESDWAKQLVARTASLTQAGGLAFVGSIEDVPQFLGSCDVHMAPSLKPEGYGLVAIEAKEAGLPSIVFAEGGLGELVEDGEDGIVLTEKTPQALADAMLVYCRDPARFHMDGTRARESLTDRLGVNRHDDAWWQAYCESLQS